MFIDFPFMFRQFEQFPNNFKYDLYTNLMYEFLNMGFSMFKWTDSSGKCDEMFQQSSYMVPEKYLSTRGIVCWFRYPNDKDKDKGKVYCLPVNQNVKVNMYNEISGWSPQPAILSTKVMVEISKLKLDSSNSVLMRNTPYGSGNLQLLHEHVTRICKIYDALDNRIEQSRTPYIFNVSSPADLQSAREMFMKLKSGERAIFKSNEMSTPDILTLPVDIDDAFPELISSEINKIYNGLGIDGVDIYKRAQQSVSEMNKSQQALYYLVKGKLDSRVNPANRVNELYDCNLKVELQVPPKLILNQIVGESDGFNSRDD